MICENPNCHCRSEVGLLRDGREACCEQCRPLSANQSAMCLCGHSGCALPVEADASLSPDPLPA